MENQKTLNDNYIEEKLPGMGELLKSSWQIYKSRFWTLIGIAIATYSYLILNPLALLLGSRVEQFASEAERSPRPQGFLLHSLSPLLSAVGGLFLVFIGILLFLGGVVALLIAIKDREESIGIIESFKRSRGKIDSYIWILILNILIIFGGAIPFVAPGIIFMVWFAVSGYVFIFEGHKGLNALFRSKEYVSGRWWSVAWQILVMISLMSLIGMAIAVIIAFIGGFGYGYISIYSPLRNIIPFSKNGLEIVANFLNIIPRALISSFSFVYLFSLYSALRKTRPNLANQPPVGKKGMFIFLAVLGLVIVPVIALSLGVLFKILNFIK